jgi:hypothetical protein
MNSAPQTYQINPPQAYQPPTYQLNQLNQPPTYQVVNPPPIINPSNIQNIDIAYPFPGSYQNGRTSPRMLPSFVSRLP